MSTRLAPASSRLHAPPPPVNSGDGPGMADSTQPHADARPVAAGYAGCGAERDDAPKPRRADRGRRRFAPGARRAKRATISAMAAFLVGSGENANSAPSPASPAIRRNSSVTRASPDTIGASRPCWRA